MVRYSPQGDMAARDVMARAVYEEINSGRGSERGGVYVDFSQVPPSKMAREYEPIQRRLNGSTTVEVGTAAHFMMGGIVIDECGRTGVPGLYACGEVTGGVHGANRLAGNALTEAVVFGLAAGRHAGEDLKNALLDRPQGSERIHGLLEWAEIERLLAEDGIFLKQANLMRNTEGLSLDVIKKEMRTLMGLHVGIVRSGSGLMQAKEKLSQFEAYLKTYSCQEYGDLLALRQLRLILLTAKLITEAAWKRPESLGAHYRVD